MTVADSKPSRMKKLLQGPFGIVIFGWGLALVVFAIIIVIVGLTLRDFGEWSFDEVARASNSNANVDAVLVETNGGATTSFGYEVFVLPRGQKPKRSDHVVASLYGAFGTNMLTALTSDGPQTIRSSWNTWTRNTQTGKTGQLA